MRWTAQASLAVVLTALPAIAAAQACPTLLNHTFARLQDESAQDLCQYRGKVLLVVNTASYCGFTPQYEGLEKLHEKFAARGLVILGFPSGDFGNQEKASNQEIAEFCFNTYGVKFPMFAKTNVVGPNANPLFAKLAQSTGSPPKWNFHKYLVGRDGQVVAAFPSRVAPLDRQLTDRVEQALATPR
jgi:glutathione peroxidase